MKRILVLFMMTWFAVSVHAGSVDGADPHDGLQGKGCDSKDKVAKLKKRFGDDYFAQHPNAGHFSVEDALRAKKAAERRRVVDQSI
jgi:hypothetical protein